MGELLNKDSNLGDYTEITPKFNGEDEDLPEKFKKKEKEPEIVAPIIPKEEPTARQRAQEAIEKIYQPIPRPKFDKTTPEYLKRTAKLGALSKGFSALGDVLSLSQGGSVNAPKKDTDTGRYIDKYFGYLDKYKKQSDEYAYRDWQNKQRLGQIELSRANRQEQLDEANRRYDEGIEYRDSQNIKSDKRYDEAQRKEQERYEAAQKWQKGAPARNLAEIKARGESYYSKRNNPADKEKKHQIVTSNGARYGFDDAEYSVTRKEAIANIDKLHRIAPSLFEEVRSYDDDANEVISYVPKKTTTDDDIIRAYMDYTEKERNKKPTPTVAETISERERVLGEKNTPVNNGSEPVTNPQSFDYKSIDYYN